MDAYVCDGIAGGGDDDGAVSVDAGAAEAHIRAVGSALLRLQRRVGDAPELTSELEVRGRQCTHDFDR